MQTTDKPRLERRLEAALILLATLAGCATAPIGPVAERPEGAAPICGPVERPLFGDLHLHTSNSLDSFLMVGNHHVDPDAAYAFAKGAELELYGYSVRRTWPLDFLAVTDHTENMGLGPAMERDPSRAIATEIGRRIREVPTGDAARRLVLDAYRQIVDVETTQAAWTKGIEAANRHYIPGRFTTLIGFEWASQIVDSDGKIASPVHRGVIFNGANAPRPFSTNESKFVDDLWRYLAAARSSGYDALTITNHPGTSQGEAFRFQGRAFRSGEAEIVDLWRQNEPLAEMASGSKVFEASPATSPADKFATPEAGGKGGEIRGAWGLGAKSHSLRHPFRFGVVGTTDSHSGLSVADATAVVVIKKDGSTPLREWPSNFVTPGGGLTGVWAAANTREAIFDALRRKMTFATSGTRVSLQFSGGWDVPEHSVSDCSGHIDMATPMGGVLPTRPSDGGAPRFAVSARKAPEGEQLRYVQIIKLSEADDGFTAEIFEIGSVGNLRASDSASDFEKRDEVWIDPHFDPERVATYYLRVIGAPRKKQNFALSAPNTGTEITAAERAWSSPIWYLPTVRNSNATNKKKSRRDER